MALVDSAKRYDCFISYYGDQSLTTLDFPFSSRCKTMQEFAAYLYESLVEYETSRVLPSVFLHSKHITERRDEAFDAILQLRGGGIGLVLLTEQYFNNKHCMAELHFLLELASRNRRDDQMQSTDSEAIVLKLFCMEPSNGREEGLKKINSLAHEINGITAENKFLEDMEEFWIHTVESRANPFDAVEEVASHVWRYWNDDLSHPNIGENQSDSFYDMQRFFVASDRNEIARALQVEYADCPNVEDVIDKARKERTIMYTDVRKLVNACRRCRKIQDTRRAVRAYERKWCSNWSWERNRDRYQSCLRDALGIVRDMKVHRRDIITNSAHIPGVSCNDLFQARTWGSGILCDCYSIDGCGDSKIISVEFSVVSGLPLARPIVRCERCQKVWRVLDSPQGSVPLLRDRPVNTAPSQHHLGIPADIVDRIFLRITDSRIYFGDTFVTEASKGLSRVIQTGDDGDVENFGRQLRECDVTACASNFNPYDNEQVPCFAVSYVHENPQGQGRFKFSTQQWDNLRRVLKALSMNGIKKCRVWLDQCWKLRRSVELAHNASNARIPIAYILWPVISLGDKAYNSDRTTSSYELVWPFLEEIAGLWSLGVFMASERSGPRREDGCCKRISFNLREQLSPEDSLRLVMLNIYHGATDEIQSFYSSLVEFLREMATSNVESGLKALVIGSDGQTDDLGCVASHLLKTMEGMALRPRSECFGGEYLDQTRITWSTNCGRWDGLRDWTSGNEYSHLQRLQSLVRGRGPSDLFKIKIKVDPDFKINVDTDEGEFQILGIENKEACRLWLLVAMEGRTTGFSRGKVKWTKIVHGKASCLLSRSSSPAVVELVLREQLGVAVKVNSVKDCSEKDIEWTNNLQSWEESSI